MPTANSNKPEARIPLQKLIDSPNVATLLQSTTLDAIGKAVVAGYKLDRQSRQEWEERSAKAVKLAMQVVESKTFPWENCSNVKFPLLTIAALQFLARISLMTKGKRLAKVEAMGADPDGRKAQQAARVSQHLSLQLLEDDLNWIDQDESAKLAASIVGSAFKKTYYDSVRGVNISEYVPAMNFVVDYFCKDINLARRATHLLTLNENTIAERVKRGLYLEMQEGEEVPGSHETNVLEQASDESEGIRRPESISTLVHGQEFEVLEQHCWLDLDGDGYAEPYIAIVRLDTEQCLRISARFYDEGDVHRVNDPAIAMLEAQLMEMKAAKPEEQDLRQQSALEKQIDRLHKASDNHIVRIDPIQHFTRILFLPSPDGGLYGKGLGSLLGPLNEAVNSLTNQLVDSGTMSNTAGGFLGRGVKVKGGRQSFEPFEWKPIDSSGDDLRKSIFPLPVREPSTVLFQLLGMLVSYSEKVSGATDIMTGVSPGQNTPAETSRNTVEQGMMLFSGIYSRMYRSFRSELSKFYELNRLFLPSSPRFAQLTVGSNAILAKDDYTANAYRVFPAASPEAVSAQQRKDKAALLLQLAGTQPGFDRYRVTRDFLEAHEYDDIDSIYPDPKGPRAIAPPPNPKMVELQMQQQQHQEEMQLEVVRLQQDAQLNAAKIQELQAKAAEHLAKAEGVDTGHQIAALEAEIGARKAHQDSILKALQVMQKAADSNSKAQAQAKGAMTNEPSAPNGD